MKASGDTPYDPSGASGAAAAPWRLLVATRPEVGSDDGRTVTEYGVVLRVLMLLVGGHDGVPSARMPVCGHDGREQVSGILQQAE